MGEDRSAFAFQPTRPQAQGRSPHLKRDHACAEDRLPLAGLPQGIRSAQDHLQPLLPVERERRLAKDIRMRRRPVRSARTSRNGQQPCKNPSLRQRRKRGPDFEAIGPTKGGRNSKIHAVVDKFCRPWAFILTPGNTADCVMAQECVSLIPGIKQLLADKGYDTDAFRGFLKQRKIRIVIPGQSQPQKENPPRQESLQRPQRRRALLLQTERLQAYRNLL